MTLTLTNRAPDPPLDHSDVGKSVPYPPSPIDRFTSYVRRLPIPYGLVYLLLFLFEAAVLHVLSWVDGWLPAYHVRPNLFLFPLWLWGPLTIVTYLDSLSRRALSEFEPLLQIPAATRRRLEYEFTTMPARSVLLSAIFWFCAYVVSWFPAYAPVAEAFGFGSLTTWSNFIAGLVSFTIGSVVYYHTIRQLRLVSRTVQMVNQFDLFRLDPVYAFSVLTARTGISWVALLTLSLLAFPLVVGGGLEAAYLVLQIALAVGAFLFPLRSVNRRLVSEKRKLLVEHNQRMASTLARLHQHIDGDSLDGVSRLNDVLKGLTAEREILAKIPTWPWRPGLLAGFLSVIVLPIVLFLIQFALGQWLGR